MHRKLILFLIILSNNSIASFFKEDECMQQTCFKVNKICQTTETTFCKNKSIFGKTFFSVRPQDSNSATEILSLLDQRKPFNFTLSYQKSFQNNKLGEWFLFNGSDCMTVGIPSSTEIFDIDATQFGLSLGNNGLLPPSLKTGALGNFCLQPQIKNYIFNFEYNFDLNNYYKGLWSRIAVPVVRTETELKVCSSGKGIDTEPFPAHLFSLPLFEQCPTTPVPYICIADALEGNKGFGSVPALKYAKFPKNKQIKSGVAGVHFNLGCDAWRNECSYLGFGINIIAPIGNRPEGIYLLEPIIGANHCWQLGGLLEFYKKLEVSNLKTAVYFYGTANHLFKTTQSRTFALKNNAAGSQYLLLKKFDSSITSLDAIERVANILSGETKINSNAMLDASIMLQASYCKIFFNLGYNFWLRTKEKINGNVCFTGFKENIFGIKGSQPVSTEVNCSCPGIIVCEPNFSTASNSTIGKPAAADPVDPNGNPIPKLLTCNDIDFSAPLHPLAISNKIFGSIGYNFNLSKKNAYYWMTPFVPKCNDVCNKAYVLLSSAVEFGHNNSALNQWTITGKFGIEF